MLIGPLGSSRGHVGKNPWREKIHASRRRKPQQCSSRERKNSLGTRRYHSKPIQCCTRTPPGLYRRLCWSAMATFYVRFVLYFVYRQKELQSCTHKHTKLYFCWYTRYFISQSEFSSRSGGDRSCSRWSIDQAISSGWSTLLSPPPTHTHPACLARALSSVCYSQSEFSCLCLLPF